MDQGTIRVRRAGEQDLADLARIAFSVSSRKEPGYFERCLSEQEQGKRVVFLALCDDGQAGAFGMLNRFPLYAPFRRLGIPEIQDLNTDPAFRRRGFASAIVRACEDFARAENCSDIGIGVGLYAGYGSAQRLYIRLGYLPDGAGVVYDSQPVIPGEIRPVDDDLTLMMSKAL